MTQTQEQLAATATPDFSDEFSQDEQAAQTTGSTLLEFPGSRSVPPWRKELSERVREIQQRRARETALEAGEEVSSQPVQKDADAPQQENAAATHLGLVPPPPEAPELNPLVVAALRRIERARQHNEEPPAPRRGRGGVAATAVAQVAQEHYEPAARTKPAPKQRDEQLPAVAGDSQAAPDEQKKQPEPTRASGLVAVPQQTQTVSLVAEAARAATDIKETLTPEPTKQASDVKEGVAPAVVAASVVEQTSEQLLEDKPKPRRVVEGVVDDAWLSRLEERILPPVAAAVRSADDTAPLVSRMIAGLIDLVIVAFISSPFAAIIELTNGNWADPRVAASMAGIVLVVMFLYLTISTALAGRTFAMALFKLHTVDAETALAPRLGQCVRRTLVYIISLATFGLGILYALFDAERRAAHDHLSGTVVVRELK